MKSNKKNSETIRYVTRLGLLFAMTVVLMAVEGAIPPIPTLPPGVKLGLSNIVVMYSLFFIGKKQAVTLLALKSGFVFLTRGVFAFFMSTAGGALSIFIMILLLSLKNKRVSYIMTSVFASIAHNIGQLCVAFLIMSNLTVFYYLPILLISGIIMGVITGTILKITLPAMKRLGFYSEKTANIKTVI